MRGIHQGDCIPRMRRLDAGSVDLVFADPPFNIGYDYDVYDDSLQAHQYLAWSREWMAAVHRVLKPDGTFWLAIGDEYAAELKILAQHLGFHCRSWVVWYYTFGVNCERKFTRSHTHLFHFVKDRQRFVFRADDPENRIPSARQLVYHDRRANPKGRLPDDTWIIPPASACGELTPDEDQFLAESDRSSGVRLSRRSQPPPPAIQAVPDLNHDGQLFTPPPDTWTLRPQDLAHGFRAVEDTWYFPRVAGTFQERAGFHGCQMPEQLLGRIIRTCSEPGALVLDPFSGSGTTLAVAKKLGREYLGFDLSPEYVRLGRARLEGIRVGDPLDGSPEPTLSAPPTKYGRHGQKAAAASLRPPDAAAARQWELTAQGVIEAFRATHAGYSADRVMADPELNRRFTEACRERGLVGAPRSWNLLLLRLRKSGRLAHIPTAQRTAISWERCDPFLCASEIAWQRLLEQHRARSLDEILCDPALAEEFDALAARFVPGFTPLEYRWGALKLRKESKLARVRAAALSPPPRFGRRIPLAEFDPAAVPAASGVYLLGGVGRGVLYVGEALDLRSRLARQFDQSRQSLWQSEAERCRLGGQRLTMQFRPIAARAGEILAWQQCLIGKYAPRLNIRLRES